VLNEPLSRINFQMATVLLGGWIGIDTGVKMLNRQTRGQMVSCFTLRANSENCHPRQLTELNLVYGDHFGCHLALKKIYFTVLPYIIEMNLCTNR